MRRGLLTATAVVTLTLLSSPARAQRVQDYTAIVREFSAGDGADAVARLSRWSNDDVKNAAAAASATLATSDLASAAMVHTEVAGAIIDTDPFRAVFHIAAAHDYLAAWTARPEGRERARAFERRWYEFVGSLCAGAGRFGDAAWYVREGLIAFPSDSMLYVVRGTIVEMSSRVTLVRDLRHALPENPRQREQIERALKPATTAYLRAADTDEANAVAWLHLGWINFYLGDSRAKAQFERALTHATDDSVRYLAHLFLGGVAERQKQPADALREYESARSLGPRYQSPYVAISRIETSLGHDDRARDMAAQAAQMQKADDDPWWDFRVVLDRQALIWLRAEARRR